MFSIINIPSDVFEENFWKAVHTENLKKIEKKQENNFYAFYKKGNLTYINASNEYDMILKLHKNTKTFIDEMPIYEEIMEWKVNEDKWKEGSRKWQFETEEEMYKYYVEEIISVLRISDYHYEKLDIIQ